MRKGIILLATLLLTISTATISAFAGEWKQEADGRWWYENDDKSYPQNTWASIDGKDYYFDAEGYMLHDTYAPDGRYLGSDGAAVDPGTAVTPQQTSVADGFWLSSFGYIDNQYENLENKMLLLISNGFGVLSVGETKVPIMNLREIARTEANTTLIDDNGIKITVVNTPRLITFEYKTMTVIFKEVADGNLYQKFLDSQK